MMLWTKRSVVKNFLVLLLAAAMFALPACRKHDHPIAPEARTAIENQHSTTHRVGVYDMGEGEVGHCSGTAVGPNALLTAQHCFKDSNLIRLDKDEKPVKILAALIDGNDHVIYILDGVEFKSWAGITERPLVANEPVHFWGAPGKNSDVYRSGYYQKELTIEDLHGILFVLPTYGGDSGSGIFDESGQVVAVISMCDESANNFDLPLAFTQDQLDITQ
jgi:V8-like Glu-specific endopeptidase